MSHGYVLVRSDSLRPGPSLFRYISEVDSTLDQYGAKILVQSFPAAVPVGEWSGFITLLQFPSLDEAQRWYDSPEYQALRDLRTASSIATDVLVGGVPDGHRSRHLLALLDASPGAAPAAPL